MASPEGRRSGDGVAVLGFPECLLDGLLTAAPGPLAIVRAAALGPEIVLTQPNPQIIQK